MRAKRKVRQFGYPQARQIERAELETELDIDVQTQESAFVNEPASNHPMQQRTTEDWINAACAELQNSSSFNLDERLRQREVAYIEAAQLISDGNLSKAARLLGINRTTLYNRIDTLAREARRKS